MTEDCANSENQNPPAIEGQSPDCSPSLPSARASVSPEHAAWRLGRVLNELRYRMAMRWLTGWDEQPERTDVLWSDLNLLCQEMSLGASQITEAEEKIDSALTMWRDDLASEWYAEEFNQLNDDLRAWWESRQELPLGETVEQHLEFIAVRGADYARRLRCSLQTLLSERLQAFERLGFLADEGLHPPPTRKGLNLAWVGPLQPEAPSQSPWQTIEPMQLPEGPVLDSYPPQRNGPDSSWYRELGHFLARLNLAPIPTPPPAPASLITQIERDLEARTASGSDTSHLATRFGLELDMSRYRVTRRGYGAQVKLDRRRSLLLKHFLEQSDRPTTLEWLMENWGIFGRRAGKVGTVRDAISRLDTAIANLQIRIAIQGESAWMLEDSQDSQTVNR